MSHSVTPPVGNDARRALLVRVAIVLAVLVALALGVSSYVASAAPPFSMETPRSGAPVAPGEPYPVGGQAGGLPAEALFVFTRTPSGAGELYTVGERPRVDPDGRWSATATVPEARDPVSVVAVRADPMCGSQLAEMAADPYAQGAFFGPLPAGCVELAAAPVPVAGG